MKKVGALAAWLRTRALRARDRHRASRDRGITGLSRAERIAEERRTVAQIEGGIVALVGAAITAYLTWLRIAAMDKQAQIAR